LHQFKTFHKIDQLNTYFIEDFMENKFTLRQYLLIAALTFIITLVVMLIFSFIVAQLGLSEGVQQTLRGGVLLFTILLTAPLVQNRFRKMTDEAANPDSK
jgi:hypothetical protein